MGKPTVMIVDDAAVNIQALIAILGNEYHIKVANSGGRCLSLLQDYQLPDLILLDIMMPDMDGYQVCKHIKSTPEIQHIPVIFITSKDDQDDEEKGLKLGAVDYITKPIKPVITLARIKTHVTLKLQYDRLADIAEKDQLTGLYNRHYLYELANQKVSFAHRHKTPLSIMMIDIDHFKKINDENGHLIGDEVIVQVAQVFLTNARNEDIVCRFGGEEFVLLMDHCDQQQAKDKAEFFRSQVEALKPRGLSVSVSIGISQLGVNSNDDFNGVLNRADNCVYQAKENGRNQVVVGE